MLLFEGESCWYSVAALEPHSGLTEQFQCSSKCCLVTDYKRMMLGANHICILASYKLLDSQEKDDHILNAAVSKHYFSPLIWKSSP